MLGRPERTIYWLTMRTYIGRKENKVIEKETEMGLGKINGLKLTKWYKTNSALAMSGREVEKQELKA